MNAHMYVNIYQKDTGRMDSQLLPIKKTVEVNSVRGWWKSFLLFFVCLYILWILYNDYLFMYYYCSGYLLTRNEHSEIQSCKNNLFSMLRILSNLQQGQVMFAPRVENQLGWLKCLDHWNGCIQLSLCVWGLSTGCMLVIPWFFFPLGLLGLECPKQLLHAYVWCLGWDGWNSWRWLSMFLHMHSLGFLTARQTQGSQTS